MESTGQQYVQKRLELIAPLIFHMSGYLSGHGTVPELGDRLSPWRGALRDNRFPSTRRRSIRPSVEEEIRVVQSRTCVQKVALTRLRVVLPFGFKLSSWDPKSRTISRRSCQIIYRFSSTTCTFINKDRGTSLTAPFGACVLYLDIVTVCVGSRSPFGEGGMMITGMSCSKNS